MQTKSQSESLKGKLGTPRRRYEFNIRMKLGLNLQRWKTIRFGIAEPLQQLG
jgi:hypothetical protein